MRAFIETIDGFAFKALMSMMKTMEPQHYEAAYMAIVGFVDSHCADWTAQALASQPAPFKPDWHDYRQGVRDGRDDTVIEMDRDEAHAMARTGRPTADLIREAFAAGATYRANVDVKNGG